MILSTNSRREMSKRKQESFLHFGKQCRQHQAKAQPRYQTAHKIQCGLLQKEKTGAEPQQKPPTYCPGGFIRTTIFVFHNSPVVPDQELTTASIFATVLPIPWKVCGF
jgi:hypothetical protein